MDLSSLGIRPSPKTRIEKLRSSLNFSHYEPNADAPTWVLQLAASAKTDLGILGLLGPSGLSLRNENGIRVRAQIDPPSLYLCALSDYLRGSGKRVAIGIPPIAGHLPLLLAASAVLANSMDGLLKNRRSGVLVISPDLDLRSRYCDLFVREQSLDSAHPGSRLTPVGELVMLDRKAELSKDGVCFFLPQLQLPSEIGITPELVLLDLRFGKWVNRSFDLCEYVSLKWPRAGVIGLYTIGDTDTLSVMTGKNFTDFPFDHQAIASCIVQSAKQDIPQATTLDWSMANAPKFLERKHNIKLLESPKLEELFGNLNNLLKQHTDLRSADLRRANWLAATLLQLPVPVNWYEMIASNRSWTLKRLIASVGIRNRQEDGLGAVYQSLKLLLSSIVQELTQFNPRADALKAILLEETKKHSDQCLQVLTRDRSTAEALESWLAVELFPGADWLRNLKVQSCQTYRNLGKPSATIINGVLPRRYKWIAGAQLGENVLFTAYSHEVNLIESQLQALYATSSNKSRRSKRESTIKNVLSVSFEQNQGDEPTTAALRLHKPRISSKAKYETVKKISGGMADICGLIDSARDINIDATEQTPEWLTANPDDINEDGSLSDEQEALYNGALVRLELATRFQGQRFISLPTVSLVDCVRISESDEVKRVHADDLLIGDVILMMSDGKRSGIFDTVVDLAERQPSMGYLGTFRNQWRLAIQAIAMKFQEAGYIDYRRVLDELRRAGATISSDQAVRQWLRDEVIGPESAESIAAVGIVSGVHAVSTQARHFHAAFVKVRAIHSGIGRRLSTVIRKTFKGLAAGKPNEKHEGLEIGLAIALDDLIESIDVAHVLGITLQDTQPKLVFD